LWADGTFIPAYFAAMRSDLSCVKKIRRQLFTGGQNFDAYQPTFRVEVKVYLAVNIIWIT
jgi:hypothetical protein